MLKEASVHKKLSSNAKPKMSFAKRAKTLIIGRSRNIKNYIFVAISIADASNLKDSNDVIKIQSETNEELCRYVRFMNKQGFYAESVTAIGVDVAEEIEKITPNILSRFPNSTFFGGQLLFPRESFATRMLHNHYDITCNFSV